MRKTLKTGKKVLAIFMATLMVMTAWVFFEPTKASAAAGSYTIRITFSSDSNVKDDYTGVNCTNVDCFGITVRYASNNGTGGESDYNFDLKGNKTTGTKTATISGFPTMVYMYFNDNRVAGFGGTGTVKFTKLEIQNKTTNNYETLWSGELQVKSVFNGYGISVDLNNNIKNDWHGTDSNCKANNRGSSWSGKVPAATTFNWTTAQTTAVTCPEASGDAAVTRNFTVTAKDQYGVQMYDPKWSVSTNRTGVTGTPGLSVTNTGTASASTVLSVTNSANIAGTTDTQTATVTATWGSKTSSKEVTINDASYTYKFTGMKGDQGVALDDVSGTLKYGHTPTTPTVSGYADRDRDYTFLRWTPTVGQLTVDRTYTAVYDNGTFVKANYTEVDKQIAFAEGFMNQDNYTEKYTPETRADLQSAIDAVVRDLGRTQEATVDGYAKNIEDAVSALDRNTFPVVFLDESGILLKVQYVKYGDNATAPSTSELKKAPDDTYHYVVDGWDGSLENITSSRILTATYRAETHAGHLGAAETVNPTCQHGGGTKQTCTVCGYVVENYNTDPIAHDYSLEKIDPLPTCTENGVKHFYCSMCGEISAEEETVDALGHVWNEGGEVKKPASCTEEGIEEVTCVNCGAKEDRPILKTQHNYIAGTPVAPSCSHSGYTPYKCEFCTKSYNAYSDAALPAHAYTWTFSHGKATGVCGACGDTLTINIDDQGGHEYTNVTIDTQPTCKTEGKATISCADDSQIKVTIPVNAKAHSGLQTTYTAPTCADKGSIITKCTACDEVISTQEIDALGHVYVTIIEEEATCDKVGSKHDECKVCGNKKEAVEIPATGHSYMTIVDKEAACEKAGSQHDECKVCGNKLPAVEIPALEHQFGTWTTYAEETCYADRIEQRECSVCGAVQLRTVADTQKTHKYTDKVIDPTCTMSGYTKHTCDYCGDVVIDTFTKALGHSYNGEWKIDVEAGCVTDGSKHINCDRYDECHETLTDVIPATGHHLEEDTDQYVAPRCETDGQRVFECTNGDKCDNGATSRRVETIKALGHHLVKTGHVDATCSAAGYDVFECDRDNCDSADRAREIVYTGDPLADHDWEYEIVQPTNDNDGSVTGHCTNCDATLPTKIIPKGDHKLVVDEAQTVKATCQQEGKLVYVCENHTDCGYQLEVILPKTEHSLVTIRTGDCNKGGKEITTCSVCGEVISQRDIEITHSWVPTVHEPTCTREGFTIYACKNCGVSYTADYVPALGHDYPSDEEAVFEPQSCLHGERWVYKCKRCTNTHNTTDNTCDCDHGKDYIIYKENPAKPALGHSWGEWQYEASGDVFYKYRQCERCKIKEYEVDENNKRVEYYQVTFVNPWATDKYETLNNGRTKLAISYKEEVIGKTYVTKGQTAEYEGDTPIREADRAYGAYNFEGWTADKANNGNAVASIANVTANTTVYAKLVNGKDVYYRVVFFNADGTRLTDEQVILHGHAAQYPWDNPTMGRNMFTKFTFKGWDYDIEHIYNALFENNNGIKAVYDEEMKQYKVVYHGYDEREVIDSEVVRYGDQLVKNNFTGNETSLNKPADRTYLYSFSGWRMSNGYAMDFRGGFTIPTSWAPYEYVEGNEDIEGATDMQKGIVHLYPTYYQKKIMYPITVIGLDIGGLDVPEGSLVQVFEQGGQLVTTGRMKADGTCDFNLEYGVYRICINSGDDAGFSNYFDVADQSGVPVVVSVKASEDINHPAEKCTCICHSFLSGIWITFHNIIYRLFGKKIVCCYDMYAIHGDKLVYGK